jgi:thioredoxin-related protein
MKKAILILVLFIGLKSFAQSWGNNLDEAKKQAAEQNKNILLVFSGSDWCGPCMKLDKNIWQSEAFKIEAKKHWILVKADFPKKKANQLSPELTESNNKLAEKYNKDGNFPLVVVLDKNGKILGVTAYKDVDSEQYIESLFELEKK